MSYADYTRNRPDRCPVCGDRDCGEEHVREYRVVFGQWTAGIVQGYQQTNSEPQTGKLGIRVAAGVLEIEGDIENE